MCFLSALFCFVFLVPRVGGSNVSLVAGGPAMFGRAFFFFVFGCGPAA